MHVVGAAAGSIGSKQVKRTSPFEERSPARLYRKADKALIFGVCAGIADYFGFNPAVTRVLVAAAALFSFPLVLAAYLVLALLLPKDPRPSLDHRVPDEAELRVRTEPHTTLSSLRYRHRDLEARLQRLEKYVTSGRYKLDREFERLRD
jgi:phage shock protein C